MAAATKARKLSPSTPVAGGFVLAAAALSWFALAGPGDAGPQDTESVTAAGNERPARSGAVAGISTGGLPTRIGVPSVRVDAAIAEVGMTMERGRAVWETAWRAAGHHIDSAMPGQPGNMVISGHVSGADRGNLAVFRQREAASEGDIVEVRSGDSLYRHNVRKVITVPPSAVKLPRSESAAAVTLVTCTQDLKPPGGGWDTNLMNNASHTAPLWRPRRNCWRGEDDMAGVRKTSGSSALRGVVYEFTRARGNAATVERSSSTGSSGITSGARELASALRLVEDAAEVRANRVRALREQIANGTYRPDPREVARRLVQSGFYLRRQHGFRRKAVRINHWANWRASAGKCPDTASRRNPFLEVRTWFWVSGNPGPNVAAFPENHRGAGYRFDVKLAS